METRFESKEDVVVRTLEENQTFPGRAYDIGQKGLKIEIAPQMKPQQNIQIAFPNSRDHVSCFGTVVWARSLAKTNDFEIGVLIHEWHGIVEGPHSWKPYKGFRIKKDRRVKPR